MSGNRGVVYLGAGKVEVQTIPFPKLEDPRGKRIDHGVILRVVSTNICGSDQHMVRGRTTAQAGLVLGHEITGEVIESGHDVENVQIGDLVSVPFNVACGRCRTCKEQHTGVCLTVNPARPGGAYGYVDMGGWIGGQAEYVMVPYADFNLLKLPRPRPGNGENPRPDLPLRHPADRLPRRGDRRRRPRQHGVCRRCRSGRPGCRRLGATAGRSRA